MLTQAGVQRYQGRHFKEIRESIWGLITHPFVMRIIDYLATFTNLGFSVLYRFPGFWDPSVGLVSGS